jgi:hypothetical protein
MSGSGHEEEKKEGTKPVESKVRVWLLPTVMEESGSNLD